MKKFFDKNCIKYTMARVSQLQLFSQKFFEHFTPARTLSISGLKSRVLKLSFLGLKMMVKSGLEFFILKFAKTCSKNFKIKILEHLSPSFLSHKCQFQDSRFKSTYRKSSSWCVLFSITYSVPDCNSRNVLLP